MLVRTTVAFPFDRCSPAEEESDDDDEGDTYTDDDMWQGGGGHGGSLETALSRIGPVG